MRIFRKKRNGREWPFTAQTLLAIPSHPSLLTNSWRSIRYNLFFVRKITWHKHTGNMQREKEPNLSPSDLFTENFYFLLEGGIGRTNEIKVRLIICWQLEKGGVAFSFRLPQERRYLARKSYIVLLFCKFHQRMAYFTYDTLFSSRIFVELIMSDWPTGRIKI